MIITLSAEGSPPLHLLEAQAEGKIITAHGYHRDAPTPQGAHLTDGVNTYTVTFDLPAGLYFEHADDDLTDYQLTTPLIFFSGESKNYG